MTEDWQDNDWEEDWPDDDDAETLTRPCSSCGADIYEDAERCPICGEYVVASTRVWDGKPNWWIVLGGLGIVATVIALTLM